MPPLKSEFGILDLELERVPPLKSGFGILELEVKHKGGSMWSMYIVHTAPGLQRAESCFDGNVLYF